MIKKINGQLVFSYSCPKTENNKLINTLRLSLLGILMGIFLLPSPAFLASITPQSLIDLTNQERLSNGLNSLVVNPLLTEAAAKKGKAIFKTQTFSHNIVDKKFSSWVRDVGYDYSYIGENLAVDFVTSEGVMTAWNNSPLHKRNLLNPYYQEIGIAAVDGKFQGQDTTVVVQIFGTPAAIALEPLKENFQSTYLNSELNLPEIYQTDWRNIINENLLAQTALSQAVLPAVDSELLLAANSQPALEAYKYLIRPVSIGSLINYSLVFLSLSLIYFLLFSGIYYLLKFKRLTF